jgi:hypothetical protein
MCKYTYTYVYGYVTYEGYEWAYVYISSCSLYSHLMYCISDVSCLRLSCCINDFIFCVHYLCLIGRVYMFYVGHVDKSSLYETLFHCNILSKYHHYHYHPFQEGLSIKRIYLYLCVLQAGFLPAQKHTLRGYMFMYTCILYI